MSKKNKKRRKEERRREREELKPLYLINTSLGNTFLDGEDLIFVKLSGNRFLRKKVANLEKGEMVVYEWEYADKDLSEIEKYLLESERYRNARENFIDEKFGKIIYKLGSNLIRGLYEISKTSEFDFCGLPDLSEEDLEQRIFKSEKDFTRAQVSSMGDYILNVIQDVPEELEQVLKVLNAEKVKFENKFIKKEKGEPVPYLPHKGAVKAWLSGDIVSPRYWDVYLALSRIHNSFSKHYNSLKGENDLIRDYNLFVVVRRAIMSYLARRKGISGPKKEHKEPLEKISITPEAQIVLSYLVDEIDEDYGATRVMEVKEVEHGQRKEKREKISSDLRLKRGVYHKEELPKSVGKEVTIERYQCEGKLLLKTVTEMITRYLHKEYKDDDSLNGVYRDIAIEVDSLFVSLKRDILISVYSSHKDKISKDDYHGLVEKIYTEIELGKFDDYFGFPSGSIINLMRCIRNIRLNAPPMLDDFMDLLYCDPGLAKEIDEFSTGKHIGLSKGATKIVDKARKLSNRMLNEYGYDIQIERSNSVWKEMGLPQPPKPEDIGNEDIYPRSYGYKILRKYDLECFRDFLPKKFFV